MVDSAVVFAACFSADWYKFSKKKNNNYKSQPQLANDA